MIIQGKHAQIKLYKENIRVFKTYKDSLYADNEYFALNCLAEMNIMNLHPKKETQETLSMDWIENAKQPDLSIKQERFNLANQLALYLKHLHNCSIKKYGQYITHEDIFSDNILICDFSGSLLFIDWGLSKKRDNIFPDMASTALGVFNDYQETYEYFLLKYFNEHLQPDFKLIDKYILDLYNEYKTIREENNFETETLQKRLNNARNIINAIKN